MQISGEQRVKKTNKYCFNKKQKKSLQRFFVSKNSIYHSVSTDVWKKAASLFWLTWGHIFSFLVFCCDYKRYLMNKSNEQCFMISYDVKKPEARTVVSALNSWQIIYVNDLQDVSSNSYYRSSQNSLNVDKNE